jgi:CxxC motif-containing protein (DUF1111 family)
MSRLMIRSLTLIVFMIAPAVALPLVSALRADFVATDPGVRGGPLGAGGPLPGVGRRDLEFFLAGQGAFQEVDSVRGTVPDTGLGLGPRFNLDNCAGCHSQPVPGGSSPLVNPQFAVAAKEGARNVVPPFVVVDGPVRDAFLRFRPNGSPDGRLVNLFTIAGRADAPGCDISQPDFAAELARDNLGFRMPTPMFGGGLVESIADETIKENMAAEHSRKQALGIAGHPNTLRSGAIGRMGWKAEQKDVELFVAGAYNGEVGVTNPLFRTERDPDPACHFNDTPEDRFHRGAPTPPESVPDVVNFAYFVRFLAPPAPAPDTESSARGRDLFGQVGCALCHTPSLPTAAVSNRALRNKTAQLYSDLIVHRMGPALADQLVVGQAGPDEFRTAPLWGVGQRIFLMHDGRTRDLREAISAHRSPGDARFAPSEANAVIDAFDALGEDQKQSVLDFLRGL